PTATPTPTATPSPSPSPTLSGPVAPPAREADHSCPDDVPAAGFLDTPTSVHRAAVDCAVWWGVAKGVTATAFQPDRGLDRAQAASFLARTILASGGSLPADPPNAFDDDDGSVHERAIDQLAAAGVLRGTGERTFAPTAPVTRAQLASYVVRAWAHRTGRTLPPGLDWFDDDDGSVHETAIGQAARAGFLTGTAPRVFTPSATATRGQVASALTRVLDLLVEAGWSPTPSA
ncbi:MAG TPA: S-layer homology domain-containing protein, partial [Mycobacteriales bacterium]|nr:S-layer homology domain-containing protein [Mycobacteriales bacterium]